MPRNTQQRIAADIARGCVVMTYKTKARAQGGRQLVSVGPYHPAVGGRRFAVITRQDTHEHLSAVTAAQRFVRFVGRDLARNAKVRCRRT